MDTNIPAVQTYNGGIIFVSYLISIIGAMTTLELLQRRTHIRGYYNWFLLFAAAALMGGVGIWSMHFIGNNSLTIILESGDKYQLSYSPGFTFLSLVVAIITMFLAFVFVGITEEIKIGRIILSGVIAGGGIVAMHYLGQVAVDFFVMKNKTPFVIGALIIAVCAVTTALFIFFKLREQWANQWYKRLGCAMLMGAAVCGMHYTALVGTIYYPGNSDLGPPTPILQTAALIGIVSAIVVTGCIILFFIVAKTKIENNKLPCEKKSCKRLILNTVFFDTNGRIMVKTDGIVPMKEVLTNIPDEFFDTFTISHPLFTKLFETSIQWCKTTDEKYDTFVNLSPQEPDSYYTIANKAFIKTATEFVDELRLLSLSDLGYLFDSILTANTISKSNFFSSELKTKLTIERSNSMASWLLPNHNSKEIPISNAHTDSSKGDNNGNKQGPHHHSTPSTTSLSKDMTIIDVFHEYSSSNIRSSNISSSSSKKLSVQNSESEDRHIFLVKKIYSDKDLIDLLSVGFRFAEPVFIAKTMSEKLKIPSEYMLNYFHDMLQMSEAAATLYTPNNPSIHSLQTHEGQLNSKKENIEGGVFVGLFVLIEDENGIPNEIPNIMIDKSSRLAFPIVPLTFEEDEEENDDDYKTHSKRKPVELTRLQKDILLNLSGQSLSTISSLHSTDSIFSHDIDITEKQNDVSNVSPQQSFGSTKTIVVDHNGSLSFSYEHNTDLAPTQVSSLKKGKDQFLNALITATKKLIDVSSYGKHLSLSAKLYREVLDIPAFSLRAGPCQLILFRAHVNTPGTRFAINQTWTESVKCIPFPIYCNFVYHITDIAIEKYRAEQNRTKAPSSYLTQQRLYQSTAARNQDLYKSKSHDALDGGSQTVNIVENKLARFTSYDSSPISEHSYKETNALQQQQILSSLPPPPRVKRSKFGFPASIGSLDISYISKDILPNMMKTTDVIPLNSVNIPMTEASIVLNLLPLKDRFWWLRNIYEDIYHA
ncbi:uncharacterized protein BX663DRAFT_508567 [Cokeromyces recurvatus]|uniref:uncharacterized protein n=1 Tax=Cokeromyces recurvatus TaxID=90255 RepID=UPI00221EE9A3|nr:uncharacterized protein BX663DRAFT_508567 [Cokeromyces recurvatus]KAI7902828.1 hypothetical protein BX663DRAFT_508567 [Cokeromyces recurvatus]